jgi:hypothetical protein
MKSMADFRSFFDGELRADLVRLDGRRKRIVKTFFSVAAVVVVIALLVAAFVPQLHVNPALLFIPVVAALLICLLVFWLLTRDFVALFKREVIGKVVRFCGESLRYSPKRHITEGQFVGSRIFKHGIDRFKGEDQVSGTVGETAVEFSEIHAEYKTRTTNSKGQSRTQWHTIFKGLFFIADFNKHFKGTTVVLPDTAERLFGFLGKKLQSFGFGRGELISLEDPEFERLFVVYGDDQVEARYILSPGLMARITDFKKKRGRQIYLSFAHSCVHVAVTTGKNMFEPRIFRTLVDYNMAREYLEDLQLALGIVDELNLNTRIWTKE